MASTDSSSSRASLFLAEPPVGPDGRPALRRILIANRGEIACRVIATCRKLNLTSIAIYVDEDKASLHVSQADESICIGSITQSSKNPFLDAGLLVTTAQQAQADAIHPGYGYLSEDPAFAQLVRDAGLVFIGPSPTAMSTLGNKRAAKEYLGTNAPDVPLIPGFAGSSQDAAELEAAARNIGYPVMLKAAAGGGGKGMRVVREPSELLEALERARSEAERSFGSADCILEKYVEAAKHVEMQVLGDRHGRAICLWERDCSVQRRHQKIVEETPCPWLSEDMRQRMAATAVRIVELIGYEGAGTVEFVVDVAAGAYYFLEVNARLQVEHPITEEITGLDLVSLQLFVAAGGRLSSLPALTTIPRNGHAIECRLCAEDPTRNFLPERGIIRLWRPAPDTPDTRFETAIQSGSEVSIHFDPMIAKVVVWAPTRLLAVEKMIRTLAQTACVGVRTNQLFLQSCLAHRAFRNPAYTTSFIPENLDGLLRSPYGDEVQAEALRQLAPVAACLFLRHLRGRTRLAGPFRDVRRGFRNQRCDPVNRHVDVVVMERGATEKGEGEGEGAPPNASLRRPQVCIWQQATLDDAHRRDQDIYRFQYVALPPPVDDDAQTTPAKAVTARYNALSAAVRNTTSSSEAPTSQAVLHSLVRIPPPEGAARTDCLAATVSLAVDGRKLVAHLATRALDGLDDSQPGRPQRVWAHLPAVGTWAEYGVYGMLTWAEGLREEVVNASAEGGGAAVAGKRVIKAPMPCRVLGVLKKDGEEVKEGENAMVVESMKMEMSIVAPANGRFRTVWRKGDAVADGEILCRIERTEGSEEVSGA